MIISHNRLYFLKYGSDQLKKKKSLGKKKPTGKAYTRGMFTLIQTHINNVHINTGIQFKSESLKLSIIIPVLS